MTSNIYLLFFFYKVLIVLTIFMVVVPYQFYVSTVVDMFVLQHEYSVRHTGAAKFHQQMTAPSH